MHSRIWVMCTNCGPREHHAFFGTKPGGVGRKCPSCGSAWYENEIIASTSGKSISVMMGNLKSDLKKGLLKVIWLEPQSGTF